MSDKLPLQDTYKKVKQCLEIIGALANVTYGTPQFKYDDPVRKVLEAAETRLDEALSVIGRQIAEELNET